VHAVLDRGAMARPGGNPGDANAAIAAALGSGVLSLGALVGFVTLFGIAARNSIRLISHVDQLVAEEGAPRGLMPSRLDRDS